MAKQNFNQHAEFFRTNHLLPGEQILGWVAAVREGDTANGALILTDQRVAYIRKGTFSTKFEPWPVERITSVETTKGLLLFDIKLHTSGDSMKLKSGDQVLAERWVAALQQRLNAPPVAKAAPVANPPSAAADPIERLERLAKLKDAGVVDEAEYQKLRTQILSEI